ncbi:hypothetical protein [Cellulomonas sp. C5510]|nr:hypothetical protein [Cellulomonas sp. C5510]QZN86870.1 hypothetical protein K5O09_07105 [Cellulomonas sp. C5510]
MSRSQMLLVATASIVAFLAGCAGMAVLLMWALLWPLRLLAAAMGAS